MTVLELNELVKACEEEFGVSAAAPVAVVGAADGPQRQMQRTSRQNSQLFWQAQVRKRSRLSRS